MLAKFSAKIAKTILHSTIRPFSCSKVHKSYYGTKMPDPRVLLLSNSTMHGEEFLQHAEEIIKEFLEGANVNRVLFVPYALADCDNYCVKVATAFKRIGITVEGIHKAKNPKSAAEKAEAFFIGGGNTFLLLNTLYDKELVNVIRRRVMEEGIPYIGSSAGTNVATISINTTNDMPIIEPPTFKAIGLVPFNINPHYLDPDPNSQHMGETREERIQQYHELQDTPPVLGIREGAILRITKGKADLLGKNGARLFIREKEPQELQPGDDLTFLLNM